MHTSCVVRLTPPASFDSHPLRRSTHDSCVTRRTLPAPLESVVSVRLAKRSCVLVVINLNVCSLRERIDPCITAKLLLADFHLKLLLGHSIEAFDLGIIHLYGRFILPNVGDYFQKHRFGRFFGNKQRQQIVQFRVVCRFQVV